MKEIRCAEVGYFPNCPGVMRGETEEEVMEAAGEHGLDAHRWTLTAIRARLSPKYSDEIVRRVRAAIRDV